MALAELGAATSKGVGRYFDVITFLPTSVLVTYVYLLARSGSWSGHPDWAAAFDALADLTVAALLAAASLGLSLILHPLQFGMTQLLEGYWGTSRPARALMAVRVLAHRRKRDALGNVHSDAAEALGLRDGREVPKNVDKTLLGHVLSLREADRLLQRYPDARSAIMPTRLGNILRRYEWQAGAQYSLPVIAVAPHLSLVAPSEHWAYVADQRTTMDRSIRLCWLSAVATLVTAAFLWRSEWWLLLTSLPYLATYLFYRGAVIAAAEYGIACATVLDLNRFTLYERLEYRRPATADAERTQNAVLLRQLARRPVDITYRNPPTNATEPSV